MKKLALGALFAGLAACGGGGSDSDNQTIMFPDGSGSSSVCNPLAQTGCGADEKCTWISDQEDPPIGHVGCTANGALAIGAACTDPAVGTGDACVKGSVCLSGECKQICDNDGGAPACDENHSCQIYSDFFESGGTTVAGVCDPGCDPLTQDLKVGTVKDACGSANPLMPSKGCYGFTDFSCAPAGMSTWTLTDRTMPRTNAAGNPYLNGCAPGFIPLFYAETGSMTALCTGLCSALESDKTKPAANAIGNPATIGKLPLSAAKAGDATCATGVKGSEGSSVCKFLWPYAVDDATGELPVAFEANYADNLGVCFALAHFNYDHDMDPATEARPYPNCATLPATGTATPADIDGDASEWGCYTPANTPDAFVGKNKLNRAVMDVFAPSQHAMKLVRHTLN